MKKIEIFGLNNFPDIKPGDDLSKMIINSLKKNNLNINDNDILVISQKIVSKSEKRIVNLKEIKPSEKAKEIAKITGKDPRIVEVILKETKNILKVKNGHIIVETKQGIVCANAGVDKSNVPENYVTLLPKDPNKSAKKLRKKIEKITGKKIGIIITDTYGRPLREGQVNFAIGASGIRIFRDYRGKKDKYGNVLQVTNIAEADEIASAAELLMGQGNEGIPVVLIRGLNSLTEKEEDAKVLNMVYEKWLFK